jgi:PP-loop superfamily ATP-utilizing enzyme
MLLAFVGMEKAKNGEAVFIDQTVYFDRQIEQAHATVMSIKLQAANLAILSLGRFPQIIMEDMG